MQQRQTLIVVKLSVVWGLLLMTAMPARSSASALPQALSAFNSYAGAVESRLSQQHRSRSGFLAPETLLPQNEAGLRRGEFVVEQLTPSAEATLPGALLHHWRGTAFVAGATAEGFDRLLRDFGAYPERFSPEVLQSRILLGHGNHFTVAMRIRQRHVITVVLNTTYDVTFDSLDAQHGYSISRSTDISEVGSPGTAAEHPLASDQEHGFLWRLNTYWSYEERDGGLYIQVESVSLTRSIPRGLRWVVQPFVQSIPRESLEFTLRSACNALRAKR